jgi:hypothetical protein
VRHRKISKILERSSGVEALSENEDTEQYIRHVIQELEKIEEDRTEPIIFPSSSVAFRNTSCENSCLILLCLYQRRKAIISIDLRRDKHASANEELSRQRLA